MTAIRCALFLLSSIVCFGLYTVNADQKVDIAKAKPDFKLDAKELSGEVKKDPVGIKKKYGGKIIEVTGVVDSLGEDVESGGPELFLKPELYCRIGEIDPWLRTTRGLKATVRGVFTSTDNILHPYEVASCIIVESEPFKPIEVTAKDLASAFAKDPKDAKKKYLDQWVLVDKADVVAVKPPKKPEQAVWRDLWIDGSEGVKLKGYVDGGTKWLDKRNESLTAGKQIRFLCKPYSFDEQEKTVALGAFGGFFLCQPKTPDKK